MLGVAAHAVSAVPLVLGLYRFSQMGPVESRLDVLRWDQAGPCWLSGLIATGLGAALISKPPHARWLVPLGLAVTFLYAGWGAGATLQGERDATPILTYLPVLVLWLGLAVAVWRAREWVVPPPEPEEPPEAD
jgi:hypothetical protein